MKNYIVDYNALCITTEGTVEPVWIAYFDREEYLNRALGENAWAEEVEETDTLGTISEIAGISLGAFGDSNGEEYNSIMHSILGTSGFYGNGILCKCEDGVYGPCSNSELESLISVLQVLAGFSYTIAKEALDYFRVEGQEELEKGLGLYKKGRYEEAHEFFRKSASMECPDGLNALAMDYIHGEGVPEDIKTGKEILQLALDYDSPKAYLNLGFYCLNGEYGIEENPEMAFQCFEKAAKLFEPEAMAWLGYLYMLEDYDFYDTAKAAYWIQKSLESDHGDGWKFLGMLIMQDDYYGYQPAYVRYCFRQYADISGLSMDEVIEETGAEDIAEEIWKAVPQEPIFSPVPVSVIMGESTDLRAQYQEALDLLYDEDTAEDGMALMLELADMGYAPACRDAGTYLVDCGQEDEFLYDDEGEICAFPADEEAAYRYMKMAALHGDSHAMRFFPFLFDDMELQEAALFLHLYTEVTGDWLMASAVAPFLENARQMDEAIPWVYPEDFFGSEELAEKAFRLYNEGTGDLPGIDAIYTVLTDLARLSHPTTEEIEQKELIDENIRYLMRLMEEGE